MSASSVLTKSRKTITVWKKKEKNYAHGKSWNNKWTSKASDADPNHSNTLFEEWAEIIEE